jgi:hypothetical protein
LAYTGQGSAEHDCHNQQQQQELYFQDLAANLESGGVGSAYEEGVLGLDEPGVLHDCSVPRSWLYLKTALLR